MDVFVEYGFWSIKLDEKIEKYVELGDKVIAKCFEIEKLENKNLYVNIIFTTPKEIKQTNKQYRNIDKETDVLSFPMLEKEEIELKKEKSEIDTLGDIVISIEQVEKQAKEYGHSFERELAYMMVHGFYHLVGYDHIEEQQQKQMREKEENVLKALSLGK